MSDDLDLKEATDTESPEATSLDAEQRALQEEYLKAALSIEEGQLLQGKVIEVGPDFVFVDIGYKSEGKIPVIEFKSLPQVGDSVYVLLLNKEGRNGQIVVSKKKADAILLARKIADAYRHKKPLRAEVTKIVKGGFEALVEGSVPAFIPVSQIDLGRVVNKDKYLGLEADFLIAEYHRGANKRLVLSRRQLLEEECKRKQEEFFAERKEGEIVEGIVKNITSFGAFIDLGGFDGLLHISDMSWGRITRPKEVIKKGARVKAVIKSIDRQAHKINLSLKDLTENPWRSAADRYKVGDVVEGKVLRLTEFGAFVELEPGIEGLLHVSELSWIKRVNHPKEILQIGQKLQVKILNLEAEKEKISLSLKQVLTNPWDDLDKRYPVGSRIKRAVKSITTKGAVFEIEEGIEGFLHVDDISWTKKVKDPAEVLKVAEEVEVMILKINKKERTVRLGLKQLSEDPWKALADVFEVGSLIEAEVVEVKDTGITVKVQGDLEGYVKRSQLFDPSIETMEEVIAKYKPGTKVKAVITELDVKKKRLQLSMREYARRVQTEELDKYLHHGEEQEEATTLADIIKQKEKKE